MNKKIVKRDYIRESSAIFALHHAVWGNENGIDRFSSFCDSREYRHLSPHVDIRFLLRNELVPGIFHFAHVNHAIGAELYQKSAIPTTIKLYRQGFQMKCPPRLCRDWRFIRNRIFMLAGPQSHDLRQAAPLPPPRRSHAETALRRTCPSCQVKGSCAARTCGAAMRIRP